MGSWSDDEEGSKIRQGTAGIRQIDTRDPVVLPESVEEGLHGFGFRTTVASQQPDCRHFSGPEVLDGAGQVVFQAVDGRDHRESLKPVCIRKSESGIGLCRLDLVILTIFT